MSFTKGPGKKSGRRASNSDVIWIEKKLVEHKRGELPVTIDIYYHRDGTISWQ